MSEPLTGQAAAVERNAEASPAISRGDPALLTVTDLGKRFGRQPALRDLSLSVAAGEVVGLVGPNGAGKSTAFRIICGLLRADAGTVTLAGCDVRRDARAFRSQIGVLIEGPGYYPGLSAAEHLRYLARVRGVASRDRVARTLEEVGATAIPLYEPQAKPDALFWRLFSAGYGLVLVLVAVYAFVRTGRPGRRAEGSRQTVNAIENGRYDPSLPPAFAIARLFSLAIENVFTPDETAGQASEAVGQAPGCYTDRS